MRALCFACVLSLVALVSSAGAQDAGARAEEDVWTRLFNEAIARMADGAYGEAAELFGRAYEEGHRSEALFNQGLALARAGKYVDAYHAFARVLTEHAHELDAAAIQDVVARRSASAAETGLLRVTTDAARAELLVDGVLIGTVERGTDVEVRVDRGPHRVVLRSDDADAGADERAIEVPAGESVALHFDSAPQPERAEQVREPSAPILVAPRAPETDGPPVAVIVTIAVVAACLLAGGIAVGVWASGQRADPYSAEPFGIVELLRTP